MDPRPADALPEDVAGEEFVLANASLCWLTASTDSRHGGVRARGMGRDPGRTTACRRWRSSARTISAFGGPEQANTIGRWTGVENRSGHFAAVEYWRP
ncbi:hypothetical protein [Actinophytocola algeriensis]|uniref:Uncharacterized protein n=1 Tax=Actinophytocola algeriensis TaxID=1768010 RepID=A0A7W7VG20_9PSEU|nr:hypothetical protein [Actinophytocola algeriensis]MBB4908878.1 hypothetical protein [Actinophytocola algeriensis]MBE1474734.1 hypothetical protein [Actinophytocola algeriensis]